MDISLFARERIPQITATIGLVTFSLLAKKLTTGGILAGIFVAVVHMLHPWPAVFWLLIVFFVLGVGVTKAGDDRKSKFTQSATGGTGGEGARTAAQVLANSGVACILILAHTYLLNSTPFISSLLSFSGPGPSSPTLVRILPIGIIAQYAAVTADTFSSELGILADGQPVLITDLKKEVPRGTNGGVTLDGVLLGVMGAFCMAVAAILLLDKYSPIDGMAISTTELVIISGAGGSLIDSLLGAVAQVTVTDKKSGKVVEGHGGQRVQVVDGGSRAQVGMDLLSNNGVNFVMAAITSLLAMGFAWVFDMEL